jgi:glycine hydroxymethyltransferase
LDSAGVPVFCGIDGFTQSHQFAVRADAFGGGQAASKTLRNAGFLACGIGLPVPAIEGDLNGLRIGTPELVRWGMKSLHANDLAKLIVRGLNKELILPEVSRWRKNFDQIHFIH